YGSRSEDGRPQRYERSERGERTERSGRSEEGRPQRSERPEGFGKRERAERSGRDERGYDNRAREYTPKPRRRKAMGEEGIRLNKFIANSGICSRREADEYITAGLITVNGEVITELGTKIDSSDDVRFNGERLKGEEKVYILMNKPKDYVTTLTDPNADKTVMDLIAGKCSQRVFPVGRLDKSTTGVLLLTNDGELADKLTHPSNNQKKIYHVFLDKNLSGSDFNKILEGIDLEDGTISADALSYIEEDKSQIGLEIHSGRNRIVRRVFEHLGYKVKKLDRVFFAGLTKKNLRRGQWRFLTEQEIAILKIGSYE
ncbi:MAG: rRNA pseudouridine synthase, partial [Bacteroidales bacterium]|nr:rRNA pseudouridine synthase [Bacteroidales bacterium]